MDGLGIWKEFGMHGWDVTDPLGSSTYVCVASHRVGLETLLSSVTAGHAHIGGRLLVRACTLSELGYARCLARGRPGARLGRAMASYFHKHSKYYRIAVHEEAGGTLSPMKRASCPAQRSSSSRPRRIRGVRPIVVSEWSFERILT